MLKVFWYLATDRCASKRIRIAVYFNHYLLPLTTFN